jgi:hypothetical protein
MNIHQKAREDAAKANGEDALEDDTFDYTPPADAIYEGRKEMEACCYRLSLLSPLFSSYTSIYIAPLLYNYFVNSAPHVPHTLYVTHIVHMIIHLRNILVK